MALDELSAEEAADNGIVAQPQIGQAPSAPPIVHKRHQPFAISSLWAPVATIAAHLLVVVVYAWIATGGTWQREDGGDAYDLLADAFMAGQVYLKVTPRPELLALPDPYDPDQNEPYRAGDLSLFGGKYYMYFGPVPAVIHAAWRSWTGLPMRVSHIDLFFGVGGCLFFWLLVRDVRSRWFAGLGEGWVLAAYLAYALGGVGPFLQARPIVHWEAVLSASFFVLAGLYFWLRALTQSRSAGVWAFAAGLCFACGFGSRMTVIGYALGAGMVLVWRAVRAVPAARWSALRTLIAFAVPSGGILALLLVYNYARFGSILDFGVNYVLVGIKGLNLPTTLFGVLNSNMLQANVGAYFLSAPDFIPYFPFQLSGSTPVLTPGWGRELPFTQPVFLAPLLLFAPLSAVACLDRRHSAPAMVAFIVGLTVGVGWALGLVLVNTFATGRYMEDFLPGACVLGSIGLYWLRCRVQPYAFARWVVSLAAGCVLVVSMIMGLTYGAVELTVGAPRLYTRVAFASDQFVSRLVGTLVPGAWPDSYTSGRVATRPFGIFVPSAKTITLAAAGLPTIRSLEVEWLGDHPARLVVEANGEVVSEKTIPMGVSTLVLDRPITVSPSGQVPASFILPDEVSPTPGALLPLLIGAVHADVPASTQGA